MAIRNTIANGGWDTEATWDTIPVEADTVVVNHNVFLESNTSRTAGVSGTGKITIGVGLLFYIDTIANIENIEIDLDGGTLESTSWWITFVGVPFTDTAGGGGLDILGHVTFSNCDFSGCAATTTITVGGNTDTQFDVAASTDMLPAVIAYSYAGGEVTPSNDFACYGFLYHTSSTGYDNAGKTVTVDGDLEIIGAAGFIGTGVFSHEGGDLVNANTGTTERFTHLEIGQAGGVSAMTGPVRFRKLTIGAGDGVNAATVSNTWVWYPVDAGDTIVQEVGYGAIAGAVEMRIAADYSQGGLDLSAASNKVRVYPSADAKTLTITGGWAVGGDLEVYRNTAGQWAGFDANGHRLNCGDIVVGSAGGTDFGKVWLGAGSLRIGGVHRVAANTSTAHELHFEGATVDLVGTIDGTGVVCSNVAGVVVGGTIDYVDLSGNPELIHVLPDAPGTGNTNVTEINGLPLGAPYVGVAA